MKRALSLEQLGRSQEQKVVLTGKKAANARDLLAAKAVLHTALERELTEKQRQCVQMYFFDGLTQEETAARLGVAKSTVCRHLQKAKERLGKAVSYAGEALRAVPPED